MLVEKQQLKLLKLKEKLNKNLTLQIRNPPVGAFSKTINPRNLKLGTRMQVHNTNPPTKFQGHWLIITPFNPHISGV